MRAAWYLTLLTAILSGALLFANEARVFKTYPILDGELDSAAEVVSSQVAEGGSIVTDEPHSRLLIMATPDEHREIEAMLGELEVPPVNIRIQVEISENVRDHQREASLRGRGEVVIDKSGAKTTYKIRPKVVDELTQSSGSRLQTLLIGSGRSGSIFIGETVPYLDWLVSYGRRWGYIEQELRWEDLGASLQVKAVAVGDGPHIRLEVIPELSGRIDGRMRRIRFVRAATTITVISGQPVSLGGLAGHEDFYRRFLVGGQRRQATRDLDITLTAFRVPVSASSVSDL